MRIWRSECALRAVAENGKGIANQKGNRKDLSLTQKIVAKGDLNMIAKTLKNFLRFWPFSLMSFTPFPRLSCRLSYHFECPLQLTQNVDTKEVIFILRVEKENS